MDDDNGDGEGVYDDDGDDYAAGAEGATDTPAARGGAGGGARARRRDMDPTDALLQELDALGIDDAVLDSAAAASAAGVSTAPGRGGGGGARGARSPLPPSRPRAAAAAAAGASQRAGAPARRTPVRAGGSTAAATAAGAARAAPSAAGPVAVSRKPAAAGTASSGGSLSGGGSGAGAVGAGVSSASSTSSFAGGAVQDSTGVGSGGGGGGGGGGRPLPASLTIGSAASGRPAARPVAGSGVRSSLLDAILGRGLGAVPSTGAGSAARTAPSYGGGGGGGGGGGASSVLDDEDDDDITGGVDGAGVGGARALAKAPAKAPADVDVLDDDGLLTVDDLESSLDLSDTDLDAMGLLEDNPEATMAAVAAAVADVPLPALAVEPLGVSAPAEASAALAVESSAATGQSPTLASQVPLASGGLASSPALSGTSDTPAFGVAAGAVAANAASAADASPALSGSVDGEDDPHGMLVARAARAALRMTLGQSVMSTPERRDNLDRFQRAVEGKVRELLVLHPGIKSDDLKPAKKKWSRLRGVVRLMGVLGRTRSGSSLGEQSTTNAPSAAGTPSMNASVAAPSEGTPAALLTAPTVQSLLTSGGGTARSSMLGSEASGSPKGGDSRSKRFREAFTQAVRKTLAVLELSRNQNADRSPRSAISSNVSMVSGDSGTPAPVAPSGPTALSTASPLAAALRRAIRSTPASVGAGGPVAAAAGGSAALPASERLPTAAAEDGAGDGAAGRNGGTGSASAAEASMLSDGSGSTAGGTRGSVLPVAPRLAGARGGRTGSSLLANVLAASVAARWKQQAQSALLDISDSDDDDDDGSGSAGGETSELRSRYKQLRDRRTASAVAYYHDQKSTFETRVMKKRAKTAAPRYLPEASKDGDASQASSTRDLTGETSQGGASHVDVSRGTRSPSPIRHARGASPAMLSRSPSPARSLAGSRQSGGAQGSRPGSAAAFADAQPDAVAGSLGVPPMAADATSASVFNVTMSSGRGRSVLSSTALDLSVNTPEQLDARQSRALAAQARLRRASSSLLARVGSLGSPGVVPMAPGVVSDSGDDSAGSRGAALSQIAPQSPVRSAFGSYEGRRPVAAGAAAPVRGPRRVRSPVRGGARPLSQQSATSGRMVTPPVVLLPAGMGFSGSAANTSSAEPANARSRPVSALSGRARSVSSRAADRSTASGRTTTRSAGARHSARGAATRRDHRSVMDEVFARFAAQYGRELSEHQLGSVYAVWSRYA